MEREWIKNSLILAPVVALMGAAGFMLWKDLNTDKASHLNTKQLRPIGQMTETAKNVKRKTDSDLYWNKIDSKQSVFDKDSIRTGANSQAVVKLNDSSVIEINENSLIVLEKSAGKMKVDFKTGDISTSGQGQLSIKIKDQTLETTGADLKLKRDSSNNMEIVVKKGSAKLIDKKNKVTDLATKDLIRINKDGVQQAMKVAVVLNTPKNQSLLLDTQKKIKYPFTWVVLSEDLKEQFFEISSSPKFKKKRTVTRKAHQAITAPINRGTSYWRVGWKVGKKTHYSETRILHLKEDQRIALNYPPHSAVFEFEPGQAALDFSWHAKGNPRLYLLEVSKTQDFRSLVHTKTIKDKTYKLTQLDSGVYFWRVQAFGEKNEKLGRSRQQSFVVKSILPQTPALVSPSNGLHWTLTDPLPFEWRKTHGAAQYRFNVTRDASLKNVVKTTTQSRQKYIWKWSKPGSYFWYVEALDKSKRVIGRSLIQKVKVAPSVVGPAITLVEPGHQDIVNRDRQDPMDPVVFVWKPEKPMRGGYTLEVSKKPDFKKIVYKKDGIQAYQKALRLSSSQNYFWRVIWRNPEDTSEIEVSQTNVLKFRVSSKLEGPELVEPLHQSELVGSEKQKVVFRWRSIKEAKKYRFTLKREHKTTGEIIPVADKVTKNTSLRSPALSPGTYHWSVTSLDQENIEGLSSQNRSFMIELRRELAAPKLRAPIIK